MADRKHMSGSEIREMFLRYFEQQKHRRVHSSSLVPANDPTLLFTNAGMNQFKDVFLGLEKRDYNRATTSQKCVRAGGKHNDLENVGFTSRHHTFFEMLGNFSFGDYFKQEAIAYAWELVTSPKWYGVDESKLYATIFKGEQGIPRDDEAEEYWLGVGVPKERIFAMGMKDNFWAMGDTGPCGPCSELHIDLGVEASDHKDPECAAGKCRFPCPHDCGRYVEIWNLVFMQFDRDAAGNYNPLPKPSIDTGMGLERVAAVLQGKLSNYDTDLFTPLIARAAELCGVDAKKELAAERGSRNAASLRVIADHARASTFLISDGVIPANEGRGYVLRKILRRGIRHGRLLGQNEPFMYQMVFAVRDVMKAAYPELNETAERVSKVIQEEERRFAHTLDIGLKQLQELIDKATFEGMKSAGAVVAELEKRFPNSEFWRDLPQGGRVLNEDSVEAALRKVTEPEKESFGNVLKDAIKKRGTVSGAEAFKLYDTFGLPIDFITDAVRDAGLNFEARAFDDAMQQQRERARASWKGGAGKAAASPVLRDLAKTVFEGYAQTESTGCEVLAIVKGGAGAKELKPGEEGEVVLDHTPFYADSGGQVGDIGWLLDGARNVLAEVRGCTLPVQGVRAHQVIAKQPIVVGDRVVAKVNAEVRQHTMRNHTATHLLHAALREVLGKHVKQAGSLVDPAHLRFDFSHFTGVADEELQDIEDLANKEVLRNEKIQVINDVPIDVAVNEYKAMALFGEKYGERVRVIKIGDFSTELCGGIHTGATGEIGLIKVLKEGSVSSGVRRVEAVTGEGSLRHFRKDHELESVVGTLISTAIRGGEQQSPAAALRAELDRRDEELKKLRKELEQSRMKTAASAVSATGDNVRTVKGVKVAVRRVENVDRNQMRVLVDNLRNQLGSGVVVLGSASQEDGKVAIVVGVTKDLTDRVQAGKIVGQVAQKVGGSGGGRPDMAEAGGKDPAQLDAALDSAYAVVEAMLS